jgi:hypothetical protein
MGTWLIAASSSRDARLSSRCVLPGDRSPHCSPIDQPFRDGKSLASAFRYFLAWSHVWTRAKHDRRLPIRAMTVPSGMIVARAGRCSLLLLTRAPSSAS